jgi:hypothetical protein
MHYTLLFYESSGNVEVALEVDSVRFFELLYNRLFS